MVMMLWSPAGASPSTTIDAVGAHRLLIERGAAAYDAAVGTPPSLQGAYEGPTLRNGRVCIRTSVRGGKSELEYPNVKIRP